MNLIFIFLLTVSVTIQSFVLARWMRAMSQWQIKQDDFMGEAVRRITEILVELNSESPYPKKVRGAALDFLGELYFMERQPGECDESFRHRILNSFVKVKVDKKV